MHKTVFEMKNKLFYLQWISKYSEDRFCLVPSMVSRVTLVSKNTFKNLKTIIFHVV